MKRKKFTLQNEIRRPFDPSQLSNKVNRWKSTPIPQLGINKELFLNYPFTVSKFWNAERELCPKISEVAVRRSVTPASCSFTMLRVESKESLGQWTCSRSLGISEMDFAFTSLVSLAVNAWQCCTRLTADLTLPSYLLLVSLVLMDVVIMGRCRRSSSSCSGGR